MKTITLERLLVAPYTAHYNIRGDIGDTTTEHLLGVLRNTLKRTSLKKVVFYMNSNGGDAAAGQIGYDILRKLSKYVDVYTVNVGTCDSAAFTIFCGGDVRMAFDYSSFTIHYSSLSGADVSLQNVNRHHKYLLSDKKWDDNLYKKVGIKFTRQDQIMLDNGGDLVLNASKADKRGILTRKLK